MVRKIIYILNEMIRDYNKCKEEEGVEEDNLEELDYKHREVINDVNKILRDGKGNE
ncbi:MAG TPA: hypothetical protein VK031_06675 [Tissierellaceae bacterium]|nr:hypothetical protein [Tissierellaceae bacterium]